MPATEYSCAIRSFKMLTPTVFELTFDTDKDIQFSAGQFISVIVPGAGPGGRDLRRAYSIASAPQIRPLELCVKLVEGGPGTNYLYKLRPGDRFKGFGPSGHFVYKTKPERHACFISTGTGIAPFRSMVFSEALKKNPPRSATCIFGVREENELLYTHEFADVPGLTWVTTVSRPTAAYSGRKGRVTDYLRSLGDSYPWLDADFYLCGNGAMIDEVKQIVGEKGVAKEAIHQEIYYK